MEIENDEIDTKDLKVTVFMRFGTRELAQRFVDAGLVQIVGTLVGAP